MRTRKHSSDPWGILNMRERAEAIGGSLRVESALGTGVRVVVEVAREQP
jgi:signal transduction histidine kinase